MSLSDARKARAETAFKRKEDQARYGAAAAMSLKPRQRLRMSKREQYGGE
jgi:hypothetical protein